jgi:heat shock protein HtpX
MTAVVPSKSSSEPHGVRVLVDDQVAANKRRSALLALTFVLVVAAAVFAVNLLLGLGWIGFVIALLVAGGSAWFSYRKSDVIALRMSKARPVTAEEQPRLHNLVDSLCIGMGLPKPALYVIDDAAPNAFATGRDPHHASVAVTTGLLEKMNRVELEAVLAHELGHVANRDILVSTLAVTMVGVVVLLADVALRLTWFGGGRRRGGNGSGGALLAIVGVVTIALAPLVARLMQAAVSRNREALADVSAVRATRYPPGLISALEKLRDDTTVVQGRSRATAHLWIESPLDRDGTEGDDGWRLKLNRLMDTHPPIEERIAVLREL